MPVFVEHISNGSPVEVGERVTFVTCHKTLFMKVFAATFTTATVRTCISEIVIKRATDPCPECSGYAN